MKLRNFLFLLLLPAAGMAGDVKVGLDTSAMNMAADPCVDFYQYACGNWMAHNPIPSDRARWGRFAELSERNEKVLLDLLRAAAADTPGRSEIDRKIGDFYAACMDTAAIEKKGLEPLRPELERIAAMESREDIAAEFIRLQAMGVRVVFEFGAEPDARDSNRTIAGLDQGGLSLPDRDYYLKTDAKSLETRQHYVEHVKKMFQLAGDPPEAASAKAQAVLDVETILARASLDRVSRRDPLKLYHPMARKDLNTLVQFPWERFFDGIGAPPFETLDVSTPDFFRQIGQTIPADSAGPWKGYFGWHLLHAHAGQLPAAFEKENFDFWQRYLSGAQEPRPREARCVAAVDHSLGDLLGRKYIEAAFGDDARTEIAQMVDALEKAMGKDIQGLAWMSEDTKKAALAKLRAITNNVGAPKKWRDYSRLEISRDDYFGNTMRASEKMRAERLGRIGKATDKTEWYMTTPTVNAFYSPEYNSINFPAGVLQPPFFDPKRDIAMNYGGAGAVIGHEMTHGFDDQGRKFDGDGNLRNWWTARDGQEFEKRAACIADEYSGFTAVDDVKLSGRLTLGENTADHGGVRVALMALHDVLKGNQEKIAGFTPDQRFFLGFAQIWCENTMPQEQRQRAVTDPHSPGRYRVNGTFRNSPEFQKAFSCQAGQPMVSANACMVW